MTQQGTPDSHDPSDLRVVALPEDFDLTVSDTLWQHIDTALTPGATLTLDCANLKFADSAGLRILVLARRTARERDANLHLTHAPAILRHLLNLAGMLHLFTLDETPADQPPPALAPAT